MENLLSKKVLRKELKSARLKLSSLRRKEAADNLLRKLLAELDAYSSVLSFASLPLEIDTSLLNRILASTGKLLLPKTQGQDLKVFHVKNLDTELENGFFNIGEPIPSACEEASEIGVVLVPALGFDQSNHRIGYGKGFYDRLLASLDCPAIGIGFREQLIVSIPTHPTDIPLTQVFLF